MTPAPAQLTREVDDGIDALLAPASGSTSEPASGKVSSPSDPEKASPALSCAVPDPSLFELDDRPEPLPAEYATQLAALATRHQTFGKDLAQFLKPDHFEHVGQQRIVAAAQDYLRQHGKLPEKLETLKEKVSEFNVRVKSPVSQEVIDDAFAALQKEDMADPEHIYARATRFVRRNEILRAMEDAIRMFDHDQHDKIVERITKAASVGGHAAMRGPNRFGDVATRRPEFATSEPPPVDWIIEGVLEAGQRGLLVAEGGTGKSYLLLQMALSIATGAKFMGKWDVKKTGKTMFLSVEDENDKVWRRFKNSCQRMGIDQTEAVNNVRFVPATGENVLLTVKGADGECEQTPVVDELIAGLKEIEDLRLLVIDPASHFRGGSVNAAEDASRFVQALTRISKEAGCAIVVANHTNKGSGESDEPNQNDNLGSVMFTNGMRFQWNLRTMIDKEAKAVGIHDDAERKLHKSLTLTKVNEGIAGEKAWLKSTPGFGGALKAVDLGAKAAFAKAGVEVRVLDLIKSESAAGRTWALGKFAKEFGGKDKPMKLAQTEVKELVKRLMGWAVLSKSPKRPQAARRGRSCACRKGRHAKPRPGSRPEMLLSALPSTWTKLNSSGAGDRAKHSEATAEPLRNCRCLEVSDARAERNTTARFGGAGNHEPGRPRTQRVRKGCAKAWVQGCVARVRAPLQPPGNRRRYWGKGAQEQGCKGARRPLQGEGRNRCEHNDLQGCKGALYKAKTRPALRGRFSSLFYVPTEANNPRARGLTFAGSREALSETKSSEYTPNSNNPSHPRRGFDWQDYIPAFGELRPSHIAG